MNEPPKQKKKYYVKLKSGYTYSIIADNMEYEEDEDHENMVLFYKDIPDQVNKDTRNTTWLVAIVKVKDVEIIGLESYLFTSSIPPLPKY